MKSIIKISMVLLTIIGINFISCSKDEDPGDLILDTNDVEQPKNEPQFIFIYSDDSTKITDTWIGNGSELKESTSGGYEGDNHYEYGYNISSWWDGFGFYVPEVDVTGADSLIFAVKGPALGHRFQVKIKDPDGQSENITLTGTNANEYVYMGVPISELVPDASTFDLSKIVEITFTLGGIEDAQGTIYVDNIMFRIPPEEEE